MKLLLLLALACVNLQGSTVAAQCTLATGRTIIISDYPTSVPAQNCVGSCYYYPNSYIDSLPGLSLTKADTLIIIAGPYSSPYSAPALLSYPSYIQYYASITNLLFYTHPVPSPDANGATVTSNAQLTAQIPGIAASAQVKNYAAYIAANPTSNACNYFNNVAITTTTTTTPTTTTTTPTTTTTTPTTTTTTPTTTTTTPTTTTTTPTTTTTTPTTTTTTPTTTTTTPTTTTTTPTTTTTTPTTTTLCPLATGRTIIISDYPQNVPTRNCVGVCYYYPNSMLDSLASLSLTKSDSLIVIAGPNSTPYSASTLLTFTADIQTYSAQTNVYFYTYPVPSPDTNGNTATSNALIQSKVPTITTQATVADYAAYIASNPTSNACAYFATLPAPTTTTPTTTTTTPTTTTTTPTTTTTTPTTTTTTPTTTTTTPTTTTTTPTTTTTTPTTTTTTPTTTTTTPTTTTTTPTTTTTTPTTTTTTPTTTTTTPTTTTTTPTTTTTTPTTTTTTPTTTTTTPTTTTTTPTTTTLCPLATGRTIIISDYPQNVPTRNCVGVCYYYPNSMLDSLASLSLTKSDNLIVIAGPNSTPYSASTLLTFTADIQTYSAQTNVYFYTYPVPSPDTNGNTATSNALIQSKVPTITTQATVADYAAYIASNPTSNACAYFATLPAPTTTTPTTTTTTPTTTTTTPTTTTTTPTTTTTTPTTTTTTPTTTTTTPTTTTTTPTTTTTIPTTTTLCPLAAGKTIIISDYPQNVPTRNCVGSCYYYPNSMLDTIPTVGMSDTLIIIAGPNSSPYSASAILSYPGMIQYYASTTNLYFYTYPVPSPDTNGATAASNAQVTAQIPGISASAKVKDYATYIAANSGSNACAYSISLGIGK